MTTFAQLTALLTLLFGWPVAAPHPVVRSFVAPATPYPTFSMVRMPMMVVVPGCAGVRSGARVAVRQRTYVQSVFAPQTTRHGSSPGTA
ncbi:hypothetical protein ACFQ1S_21435, partial [Kibdelosporangium lantanae]